MRFLLDGAYRGPDKKGKFKQKALSKNINLDIYDQLTRIKM